MNVEQIREVLQTGKVTTPSYVLDMDVLETHLNKIKTITEGYVNLCYAMKANPFIVHSMSEQIGKVEVCSPGELEICKKSGVPGEKIIFSGVNKTEQDVNEALDYGVSVITIESRKHFDLIRDYCTHHQANVHVLLRLTSGSQFGMGENEVEELIAHQDEYPQLMIGGIHFFSGTQKKKHGKIEEELQYLQSFLNEMKEKYGYVSSTLEYGAGLAVPYFEGDDSTAIYDSLNELVQLIDRMQLKISVTLELGRYFAWSCGQYLTRVEDVKCNHGHNYAIVDGGIHQLNYYGQNMAMRVPHIHLLKENDEESMEEWTICGSLCTFADVLVRKWTGHRLTIGDVLVFDYAGSYSMTEAPALFLSRRMPVIYEWSEKDGLRCIRDAIESYGFNCKDI